MSDITVTTTEQTTVVETTEQTVVIQVVTPEGTDIVEPEQGTTVVEVYVQGPQGSPGEGADVLTQSISDGDTTHAPSGDAVFDALAAQTAATAAVAADLATHEADTANPHAVTQTQLGISTFIQTLTDDANQAAAQATLGIGSAGTLAYSTDGTFAANSDALIPTQKAVKTYADALIAANDVMQLKGVIDCSANPNYPAADAGHTYRVSVAGKIGGASGVTVEAGDILLCLADSTASGNHATVGTSWTVVQVNIIGALTTSDIGSAVQAYDATLAALAGADWESAKIPIGSGANTVAQQAISGDATLAANGVLTLANTAVTPASYTLGSFTVDSKGRITAASNGEPLSIVRWTLQTAAPSAASAGESKLSMRDIAGLAFATLSTASGYLIAYPSMTDPLLRGTWIANSTARAYKSAPGAVANFGTVSSVNYGGFNFSNIATAATTGQGAQSVLNSLTLVTSGGTYNGYITWMPWVVPDASYGSGSTGCSIFAGNGSTGVSSLLSATDRIVTSERAAGFSYDTTLGDTNWQFTVRSGTGSNITTADTGIAFTAQHHYFGMMFAPPGGSDTYWFIADITAQTCATGSVARQHGSTACEESLMIVTRDNVARNIRGNEMFTLIPRSY